ncbi:hypothetical protein L6164_000784 [Bauhinia variegata]|uniref:Uncharacterized protein n=1 Tax=Bauhinia variegata TaxID=167791 RepID=A0ACB9Q9N9_BAUVA|nr:hypothetical protein L6164_000784 [Bauhinia variegata]
MQRGREGRDNHFESSNAFSGFGDFGGFGFHRSVMPSLFGGRDPFDDPFFTQPFGSMFGPSSTSNYMQKASKEKGVLIEELDSDDEGANNLPDTGEGEDLNQKTAGSAMDIEPTVEHPDDDDDHDAERKNKSVTFRNEHYKSEPPKSGKFSFQTSKVTYGGIDGTYYSSSRSRRRVADGAVIEESKEADMTTGQATHRISKGIHDKGHSLTRRLNSDGKVDSMQTLHNLNEDELAGFEEAWKGNSTGQLQGWKNGYDMHGNEYSGSSDPARNQIWGGREFPSFERTRRAGGFGTGNEANTNTSGRTKKVVRINID